MSVFGLSAFADHEQVVQIWDAATWLRAIIAIHSTVRGPAIGGRPIRPYADESYHLVTAAEREFGAAGVEPDAIYGAKADVFAPCALGAVVNDDTLPLLTAP